MTNKTQPQTQTQEQEQAKTANQAMSKNQYAVTGKREVPIGDSVQSGKKAVCVRLFNGGWLAWGYGDSWEEAEQAAVTKAVQLSKNNI